MPTRTQQLSKENTTSKPIIPNSESLMEYINGVSKRNENTTKQYISRLMIFEKFVYRNYEINLDNLIQQLKDKIVDPYDILNDFCIFLQNKYTIGSLTFRDKIITIKTSLENNDIEISPRKFKLKIIFPEIIHRHKEAVDKYYN